MNKCDFFGHKWKFWYYDEYDNASYSLLYLCERCGKITGQLELE